MTAGTDADHRRVVVVTGASSGIGRLTARRFARRGDAVVLAARDEDSLEDAARDCRAAGARTLIVPVDINRPDGPETIMDRAVAAFGHVDVWVSCAAVMAYGRFQDVPQEVHEQVIATNLTGTVRCARVAVQHFLQQGHGVLITVGSLYGRMTSPYVSAYVTSKYGLRGFNEVLRQELHDVPDITTCLVQPGSVDTPIFRHTANYTGRGTRPVPPVVRADRVARAIVRCADRPRREVVVGQLARVLSWVHAAAPWLYNRLVPTAMDVGGLTDEPAEDGPGNVFEPMAEWNRPTGDWDRVPHGWLLAAAGVMVAAGGAAAAVQAGRPVVRPPRWRPGWTR